MKTQKIAVKEKSLARRYAKVLFELAEEGNNRDNIQSELSILKQALREIPLLGRTLENKRAPLAQRQDMARQIARSLGLSTLLMNTILYLMERDRFYILPLLTGEYRKILEAMAFLARAKASVAQASLSDRAKKQIEEILSGILKMKTVCEVSVEPSLIGGMMVQIGDVILDTSVAGQLQRMQEKLL